MTGNSPPLVSVIMPYYNGRRYVREALQSLLDQTYENIEIVVVNDASPNEEDCDCIRKLADEIGFKLIEHSSNKGIGPTMADAAEVSSGEFIAELSQDDLYKPEKIERQVDELTKKKLDAVYTAGDVFYQDSGRTKCRNVEKTKKIIEAGVAAERLRLQNLPCISIQGLLARRSVFEKDIILIWRQYLLDDWPVNIRLFERYRVGFVEEPLWTSRSHGQNTSEKIWKWFGPQIEVAARMAPEQLKTEAVGNRISSMARRLQKQGGGREEITRLALAGLMLTESREQYKKAARVLDKMPSEQRKTIAGPKAELLQSILKLPQEQMDSQTTAETDWENLGRKVADIVSAHEGAQRLNGIARVFSSLAGNIFAKGGSPGRAVRVALASVMMTHDQQDEATAADLLRSVPAGDRNRLIRHKKRILRTRSRPSLKSFFGNKRS